MSSGWTPSRRALYSARTSPTLSVKSTFRESSRLVPFDDLQSHRLVLGPGRKHLGELNCGRPQGREERLVGP